MKTILIFALLLVGAQSQAAFLFEPNLGYAVSGNLDPGPPITYTFSGLEYGARLGYDAMGLQVGAGYKGMLETEYAPSVGSQKPKVSGTQYAAFLGYQFPVMVRILAEYIFLDYGNSKLSPSDLTYKGSGYRIGAHYSVIPMLNIGMEYYAITYTEVKDNVSGVSASLSTQQKKNAIVIIASVPISF